MARERDDELKLVAAALRRIPEGGARFAACIRKSMDQLLRGHETMRYSYDQLSKTEKTHLGTLVELNLALEFDWDEGREIDYRIADAEVDCKWSRVLGEWEIPKEMYKAGKNHLALLVWGSDDEGRCKAGLVRVRDDLLRTSRNQDEKRKLNEAGMSRVEWIWDEPLPENLLYHLPDEVREKVLDKRLSGQRRVDMLFRLVPGRPIPRTALATVAKQLDPAKRARGNGGSRSRLRAEGFLILGHQVPLSTIAADLGLPVPRKGEWLSVRVAPAEAAYRGPVASIAGGRWRVARPGEQVPPAPDPGARVEAETD